MTHAAQPLTLRGILCSVESPEYEGRSWRGEVELIPLPGAGPDDAFTHEVYQIPSRKLLGKLHSYELAGESWQGPIDFLPVRPQVD